MDVIIQAIPQIFVGFEKTVQYSFIGILFALIIGLIFALFKLSKFRVLRWIGNAYVEFFRCTPLLIQILFIYFSIPMVFPQIRDLLGDNYIWIAASFSLAMNEGSYITEIVRAGILSIDRGQKEAAHSIGMTPFQSMLFIVLPQAFKRMIPPLVNQSAQTIKDTSLLSMIGISELIYKGQVIVADNFASFRIYGFIAVWYFVIIFLLTRIASRLERRLQVDKR